MADGADDTVDQLLERVREGDGKASEQLFSLLYSELHAMAGRMFRSQRAQHTLQPTAVVHEAFLKMARPARAGGGWQDRNHFFAVAARAMRQVLVNHARDRSAAKRGGGDMARGRVTLSGVGGEEMAPNLDVLAVNEALEELAHLDPRQARIAELRFFAGLSNREVAEIVGISLRSVELDWKMAKAWLAGRLDPRTRG